MIDRSAGVRGERLALTSLTSDDLPSLFGWINDRRELLWNAPYRPANHR
jgi:hypothetical protein